MQAENRSWLGAIASAIQAFCVMFINLVEVVDVGVSIAGAAARNAELEQADKLIASQTQHATTVAAQAARAIMQDDDASTLFVGNDPKRKATYDAIYADLAKQMSERRKRLEALRARS